MIFSLALKDILKNYKKSLAIVIAIILSTVLLSSVSIITGCVQESMIREAETLNGKYHLSIQYSDKNDLSEIEKILHKGAVIGRMTKCGISKYNNITIALSGSDETDAELSNLTLKSGNFPKAENEICLEEWLIPIIDENLKIGGEFTLPVYFQSENGSFSTAAGTEKNVTFTLSGILNDTITKSTSGGTIGMGILSLNGAEAINIGGYCLHVKYPNASEVNNSVEAIQRILSDSGTVNVNKYLCDAQSSSQFMKFKLGFSVVIALVAILCIYNIFNIIMLEKKHYFAVLRCTGFRNNDVFFLVMLEAFLLAVVSIPIGAIFGTICAKGIFNALFTKIINVGEYVTAISATDTIIVIIFAFLIVLGSALYPALNSRKISPLEALRKVGSITNRSKGNSKPSEFIEKRFGITAKLTYENMRIHKQRTAFVIVSLTACTILGMLIVFVAAGFRLNSSYSDFSKGDYYINVDIDRSKALISENDISGMLSVDGVKSVEPFRISNLATMDINVNGITVNEKYADNSGVVNERINLYGYPYELIEKLNVIDGDISAMNDMETPTVLIDRTCPTISNEELPINLGDTIQVAVNIPSEEMKTIEVDGMEYEVPKEIITKTIDCTVGGFFEDTPYNRNSWAKGPEIVMSSSVLDSILGDKGFTNVYLYTESDSDTENIEIGLKEICGDIDGASVVSYIVEKEKQESSIGALITILSVFAVTILTISILNIYNTISSGIIVREREFGIFRALGTTKSELSAMILNEGMAVGVISAVLGIILGIIACIIVKNNVNIPLEYSTAVVLLQMLVCILNVFICTAVAMIPLKKVLNNGILKSLREE